MTLEMIMIILATIFSGLSLLMSALYFIKLKYPSFLLLLKLLAVVLSPYWAIMGIVGALIGWIYDALWIIPIGLLGAGWMTWYVWRSAREHNGFKEAFGTDWSDQISPEQTKHMVQKRWTLFLKMKTSPEPACERNIPFWTIPDTDRELLCDIWRPANGNTSGLAFIYYHGSGWWIGDKDLYKTTRPFFHHLVSQGHTVMDVAYRLCPEVDIYGMIGDVKRAIVWMKANADRYGVNPQKIVLGGGSAGAHLALLAGYTPHHPELTPEDVKDVDLSVCGIVSYYGPVDLVEGYHRYTEYILSKNPPPVIIGKDIAFEEKFPTLAGWIAYWVAIPRIYLKFINWLPQPPMYSPVARPRYFFKGPEMSLFRWNPPAISIKNWLNPVYRQSK
jgi:acetyl esterase/lipase